MPISPIVLSFPTGQKPIQTSPEVVDNVYDGRDFDCEDNVLADLKNPRVLVRGATEQSITIVEHDDGVVLIIGRPPIGRLAMSGGGVKGAAFSGAIEALEAMDIMKSIHTISGSSAGAISAALLASGMNHKGFDRISDKISLIQLLDSDKADVKAEQREWSRMGENMKALPMVQLLCNLLPRLGTKGTELEKLIREESCAAFVALCKNRTGLTELAQKAIADVQTRNYVTFRDLEILSKEVKEIKALEITGTAMFKEGAQLVVFSAELTPDMDIAKAAHISAALPIVFSKPTEQGLPFQERKEEGSDEGIDEVTAFADGGILRNTPIHGLGDPVTSMSAIPDEESLILVFESVPSKKSMHGTGLSAFADWFLGAPHAASSAHDAKRMEDFEKQIVTVLLNTKEGDRRGMLKGTLAFDISEESKNYLQEELRKETLKHLDKRGAARETHPLPSLDTALLALNDKLFIQLGAQLEGNETYAEVKAFRQAALTALSELKVAITPSGLEPTPELRNAILNLDVVADTPDKVEWLAKRITHDNDPDFMYLLQAAVRWDREASDAARRAVEKLNLGNDQDLIQHLQAAARREIRASAHTPQVIRQAVEEMNRRDIATRAANVVQHVLYRSLFRGGQPGSNITLLSRAIHDLNDVQNKYAFNNVLLRVIHNYKSRSTGLSNPKSTTINDLRERLIH
ncbi:patatin-like phospholipase family protein [Pseudomonas sp. NFACC08-1]|uniref:patatin-like phospholipase family protein n=1 Tax=Pseudomonas sp. NFACC08-1 TaxID=1566238 RepID=UPI0008948D8A|nr:patatin-like phospholipase family protein [Pseudomonas sp. NFACC08-1]SDW22973.1 exoenzyme U [Pseudomonas sp. NFACC08-1]